MGAIQFRYAITDRLAFIATQDGYLNINGTGVKGNGWMDLAAGFKYALINDVENQFILTPGFTFQLPTGDNKVFNGRGSASSIPSSPLRRASGISTLQGTSVRSSRCCALNRTPWRITA